MKRDVTELKKMFVEILQNPACSRTEPAYLNELKEFKQFKGVLPTQVKHPSRDAEDRATGASRES